MKLTDSQRRAIQPDAHVWVGASAGSGKTHVLTNRVLRLMLDGAAPRRILCMTFTKAAAAQMANRLQRRLAGWATAADADLTAALIDLLGRPPAAADLARARGLFARVLDEPGGLKIQTIHAFCQSILARFPLEAGVPPNAALVDEGGTATLRAAAQAAFIAAVRADPDHPRAADLDLLTDTVTEMGFDAVIGALIGARRQLRHLFADGGVEAAIARVADVLGADPTRTAEDVWRDGLIDDELELMSLRSAAEALSSSGPRDQPRGASLRAFLEADVESRVVGRDAYLKVFLTQKNDVWAARSPKAIAAQAAEKIEPAVKHILMAEGARLLRLEAKARTAATLQATAAALRVGHAILEAYTAGKRRQALVDYDDLILAVEDLLTRMPSVAPWVLYKLDGGIDHLLVDEAQDTNPEQWAVVRALAAEFHAGLGTRDDRARTLFVVGDVKQSIYSFQGADPAAFDAMRRHFDARFGAAGAPLARVPLAVSFRSAPAILTAVDAVFAEGTAAHGGLLLAAGEAVAHIAHRAGMPGRVEVWPALLPEPVEAEPWAPPVVQETGASPAERLAATLADTIKRWLDAGEWLPARGRPVRAGDIMILVRRRQSDFVPALMRALKAKDVPVAGQDRMAIAKQMPVRDLIALARFVLLPEDDLSLAEVLRGPLIGLDEDDLFDLAHPRLARDPVPRLWQALGAARDRFGAAHDRLSAWLALADFVPPFEFFTRVLSTGGGRAALAGRLGAEVHDPLDELLSLALAYERDRAPSLQGFLAWLESGAAEVKRDMEQVRDEVRVMTVHGAKGLEAPVVILPDTLAVPGRPDTLYWQDDVPLWPVRKALAADPARAAAEAAKTERVAEYMRLLYVAMTRAEDRLIVCGWATGKSTPDAAWHTLVHDALAALAGAQEIDTPTGRGLALVDDLPEAATVTVPRALVPVAELPDWIAQPRPEEPTPPRPLTPSQPDADEPAAASPIADDGARFKRGLLIHQLLEVLPDLPPDTRAAAADRYLAAPAQGLTPDQAREMRDTTLAVLNDPAFAALFGPGSRAEVPITGHIGGRLLSGQVDRLLVTGDAVLVVDYKTNRPAPGRVEDVAPAYLRQMAAYRAALKGVYPDRPVRCALLWTQGPRLMPLPDDLLVQVDLNAGLVDGGATAP